VLFALGIDFFFQFRQIHPALFLIGELFFQFGKLLLQFLQFYIVTACGSLL